MTSETPRTDELVPQNFAIELQSGTVERKAYSQLVVHARQLERELAALRIEVDRCHGRLEIDRVYQGDGTERVTVPYEERKNIPDGISCRNETIRLLEEELDRLRADKDQAYLERNHLVAALARLFPSGIRKTDIPGWSPDWHGCCTIDLPIGQISYHYHDSHAHLFAGLPAYTKAYDGHSKDTVHKRLGELRAARAEPVAKAMWQVMAWGERDFPDIRYAYSIEDLPFAVASLMFDGPEDENAKQEAAVICEGVTEETDSYTVPFEIGGIEIRKVCVTFPRSASKDNAQRYLLSTDPFCPSCGHNRDKSSVSTVSYPNGSKRCQCCGASWFEDNAQAVINPVFPVDIDGEQYNNAQQVGVAGSDLPNTTPADDWEAVERSGLLPVNGTPIPAPAMPADMVMVERKVINEIRDQAEQGVFIEHECPANFACSYILLECDKLLAASQENRLEPEGK